VPIQYNNFIVKPLNCDYILTVRNVYERKVSEVSYMYELPIYNTCSLYKVSGIIRRCSWQYIHIFSYS